MEVMLDGWILWGVCWIRSLIHWKKNYQGRICWSWRQGKQLNQTWSMHWLSQRRERRNRGRRRHQESSQLHGERWRSRGRWEWRQSWNTFTLTLMFPESHSPAGSWFHISRSARVWVQAGNREVKCELRKCESTEAHGGELSFAHRSASAWETSDDPLEKRDDQTSLGCCFLVTILKLIHICCAVLETLVVKSLHGLRCDGPHRRIFCTDTICHISLLESQDGLG